MAFKLLGVIGPNTAHCPENLYDFGVEFGKRLAYKVTAVVCGGMGGFMEAVCRGIKSVENANCLTIGLLPSDDPTKGNRWLDVVIPTGMGLARNVLVVNSAHLIVAAGGGPGTLSELAFALQLQKTVICLTPFGGFSQWLAEGFASQYPQQLVVADDLEGVLRLVDLYIFIDRVQLRCFSAHSRALTKASIQGDTSS